MIFLILKRDRIRGWCQLAKLCDPIGKMVRCSRYTLPCEGEGDVLARDEQNVYGLSFVGTC